MVECNSSYSESGVRAGHESGIRDHRYTVTEAVASRLVINR